MHLLIPFASAASEACAQVLGDLPLPHLSRLLARLTPQPRVGDDATTLSPPHERALADAWGWHGADGALPFAAHAAAADGVEVGDRAWGLLTPVHLLIGRTQFTLTDPAALRLGDAESRAFFEAVRELFESAGFTLAWGAATRWYAAHESFADLPCASLDRVIGNTVDDWLQHGAAAERTRLLRRLQSEVQLLLYPHPLNEEREARGAPTVNSFWLSGCGRGQAADAAVVDVDASLRRPLLATDWSGWAAAWRALDSGVFTERLAQLDAGTPLTLTLCGERSSQRFTSMAPAARSRRLTRALWQRVHPAAALDARAVLAAL